VIFCLGLLFLKHFQNTYVLDIPNYYEFKFSQGIMIDLLFFVFYLKLFPFFLCDFFQPKTNNNSKLVTQRYSKLQNNMP
jgi:hypothetical protein